MYYSKDSIAKIFSLASMIKPYQVTYDSAAKKHFHCSLQSPIQFTMTLDGLFAYKPPRSDAILVNIVMENKFFFIKRWIQCATRATTLQQALEFPSN